MDFNQAKEIMNDIYTFYPNFNSRGIEDFDKKWIKKLMSGDYDKTRRKTDEYLENNKFPPTLADVFVPIYKPVQTHDAEMLAEAEKKVAEEMKDPEIRADRERMVKEMMDKLKGVDADG